MHLSNNQRADIETALDRMAERLSEHGLLTDPCRSLYVRSIRLVREVPDGHRRVRSDHAACLADPQPELAAL